MNCLIVGSKSDIVQGMLPLFEQDGWTLAKWHRGVNRYLEFHWDLMLVAIGKVAPVGLWHESNAIAWEHGIMSNLLDPMDLLRRNWKWRNPGASVCFMAGSNPNMIMDGYSSYNVGKMALLKLCEQLDHETPDCKFFALNPGTILTKIHKATIDSKWDNPKLEKAMSDEDRDEQIAIRHFYGNMVWCMNEPKEVVGGRNICVSDFIKQGPQLLRHRLQENPELFKLRRVE